MRASPQRKGTTANWLRVTVIAVCVLNICAGATAQTGGPVKLQCESLINPLGMDSRQPTLSWQLQDSRLGARQTAYQVQVASSAEKLAKGDADVWDSGRVSSGQSRNVKYAGAELKASTRYFWRVIAWDANGKAYAPSEISWWEMGLMDQAAWKGKWTRC